MSLQDLKHEVERLLPKERRELAAFLVPLSHRDDEEFTKELGR